MVLLDRLLKHRSWDAWVADYASSHQHPVNRSCHSFGIPLVVLSVAGLLVSIVRSPLLMPSAAAFVVGCCFQFVGNAFEGKLPDFFRDWRYLLVGLSWWVARLQGRL